MTTLQWVRQRRGRLLAVMVLLLTLAAACQERVAQVGIPLAYGLTGMCLASKF